MGEGSGVWALGEVTSLQSLVDVRPVCPNSPSCHQAGCGARPPQNKQNPRKAFWTDTSRASSCFLGALAAAVRWVSTEVLSQKLTSLKSLSDQKQQHELGVLRTRPGVLEDFKFPSVSLRNEQSSSKPTGCREAKKAQQEFFSVSIKARR